jgi:hypothetical protein
MEPTMNALAQAVLRWPYSALMVSWLECKRYISSIPRLHSTQQTTKPPISVGSRLNTTSFTVNITEKRKKQKNDRDTIDLSHINADLPTQRDRHTKRLGS